MPQKYRYVTENVNYEDYAPGRVLVHRAGATSFPTRLASEIFQRCQGFLHKQGQPGPYRLYDPLCGTGHLLTMLGLLHREQLSTVIASDIDAETIEYAARNLSLLTSAGMDARIVEIKTMIARFDKQAHREALASAQRLKSGLAEADNRITTICFVADATHVSPLRTATADIIIADVPYGSGTRWQRTEKGEAIELLLDSVQPVLAALSVVAIVSDKQQSVRHPHYRRVEKFVLGKRQINILRLID